MAFLALLAIIGAGQLGSRHLQALHRLGDGHSIYVVDPSKDSLARARERYEEMQSNHLNTSGLIFCKSADDLPRDIDVAVVATNSGVRKAALEKLLEKNSVSHFILEKVLFANISDYDWAEKAFQGRSAFVNCPLRITEWPRLLKPSLQAENLVVHVSGSALGLACNSIHYVDLFNYFTGRQILSVRTEWLEKPVFASKRAGYFELSGELSFEFGQGFRLSLSSLAKGNVPTSIEILTEGSRHVVSYQTANSGTLQSSTESQEWTIATKAFVQLPQSQLTHLVIKDLLENGTCELTPLLTSIGLHRPLVHRLAAFFDQIQLKRDFDCPIT